MAKTSANVFNGLAGLRQHEAAKEAASSNRVNWLTVDPDSSVEILFLQELDDSSERYLEDNGLGIFAQEHSNPAQFFRRVICTNTEDHDFECWPCQENKRLWDANAGIEKDADKYKGGWKAKVNFYTNVLVRREGEDDEVAVLSRVVNKNSYVHQLIEDAEDEGYITNRWYRLTRSGEGFDTTYRLKALKDANLDLSEYTDKLTDLSTVLTEVDAEGQPAALGLSVVRGSSHSAAADDEDDPSDSWL